MRSTFWVISAVFLSVFLTTGAWAEDQLSEPVAIEKAIERLRVHYTDEHPDIQRLLRHLEKAKAMQEAQKARQRQRDAYLKKNKEK